MTDICSRCKREVEYYYEKSTKLCHNCFFTTNDEEYEGNDITDELKDEQITIREDDGIKEI